MKASEYSSDDEDGGYYPPFSSGKERDVGDSSSQSSEKKQVTGDNQDDIFDPAKLSRKFGTFQKALLKMARRKLRLMLSEVCQCKQKKALLDFSDRSNLTFNILNYISSGKITSAHISSAEARQFLTMLDDLTQYKKEDICKDFSNDVGDDKYLDKKESPFGSDIFPL